jgi:recombination protein RecR
VPRNDTPSLDALKREIGRLAGIGPKSAERLAYHVLRMPADQAEVLVSAIRRARERIRHCRECGGLTEAEVCAICEDPARDRSLLCIVEKPQDLLSIERTGEYRGLYHVLMGAISPLDGVGPSDLRVESLRERVVKGGIREVIVATNANVEGEATSLYLKKMLEGAGARVTRLAHGLPLGGELEFADLATLALSLSGRREIDES